MRFPVSSCEPDKFMAQHKIVGSPQAREADDDSCELRGVGVMDIGPSRGDVEAMNERRDAQEATVEAPFPVLEQDFEG